jgi:predicted SAM-dependent methyltransferase
MHAGAKSVIKLGITTVHSPVGRWRLQRALAKDGKPRRFELGSNRRRPGWLVTNASWRARYFLDAAQPWPVDAGSVDLVFADNVIEHLTLDQGRAALRHAHAALRPGGTIRLATPDIEAAARLYLGEDEERAAAVLGMHRQRGRIADHQVDLLRVPFTEFGHHLGYLYDEASLGAELKRAGFHDIRRCDTGQSEVPALRNLENRLDEEDYVQFILEADA